MLKFQWNRTVTDEPTATSTGRVTTTRDDLRIRNLLDDPRLAQAMALDLGSAFDEVGLRRDRPEPVFNRRRLLESDAA